MKLEYKDLCIRNAELMDCEQLAIWWNDGKVMEHAGFPNGLGISVEEIRQQIATDSDHTKRRLMIIKDHMPIGEMVYYDLGNHCAEIGIKICNTDYQEKGLGRILLSMFIKALFHSGYETIKLNTNLNNKRAQHVYEKLGFSKVGVRKNCLRDQLGNLQSAVDYELTQESFVEYR